MKRVVLPITIAAVIVAIVAAKQMSGGLSAKSDAKKIPTATVSRGDLDVDVIETGTVDALKTVEVRPLVSGRLAKLLVQEGDTVRQGQLVAVIDPKETQLKVQQDAASLLGARSVAEKNALSIAQRKDQAKAGYEQAKVHAEQLKVEMDTQPELTRLAIAQAENNLSTAIEQRRQLLESTHPTARTSAISAVREAEANIENAQQENSRQQGLLEKGYVAAKAAQSAKLALDLAQVRLDQAKDNLAKLDAQVRAEQAKADYAVELAESELRTAKANRIVDQTKRQDYESALSDLAKAKAALQDPAIMEQDRLQSQASVSQLTAALGDSQWQLNQTEVRAPMSGVVTKKELEVGELASGLSGFSSGTQIIRIEDRSGMRVKLDVNEIDVAKMTVGMPALIDVDAIPQRSYHGIITRIAPASKEAAAGTSTADAVVKYEVEIQVKDADSRLRSGMSAKCTLQVVHRVGALVLPIEFVNKVDGKYFADVLPNGKLNGKADHRRISVGAESGSQVEVLGGLKEGDVVRKPTYTGPPRKGMMEIDNGN